MSKPSEYALLSQIAYGTTKFGAHPVENVKVLTGAANAGQQGTLDLFAVTGTVLVKMFVVVETQCVGTGGTMIVGTANSTNGILTIQTMPSLAAGAIWYPNSTGTEIISSGSPGEFIVSPVVGGDGKIKGTIATHDLTAGKLHFFLSYVPLSDGAKVEPL